MHKALGSSWAVLQIKYFISSALIASAWKQAAAFWEDSVFCWPQSNTFFLVPFQENTLFKAEFDPGGISYWFCFAF